MKLSKEDLDKRILNFFRSKNNKTNNNSGNNDNDVIDYGNIQKFGAKQKSYFMKSVNTDYYYWMGFVDGAKAQLARSKKNDGE